MERDWFENTKLVAYYLWENTAYDNALALWYAAEDIASFFEQANILDLEMVESIKRLGLASEGYVWFIRNIAFRLHVYTQNQSELTNWFLVERLLNVPEWTTSLTNMASILRTDTAGTVSQIRSDAIRIFYGKQTL